MSLLTELGNYFCLGATKISPQTGLDEGDENSPAFQGWVKRAPKIKSPVRDERKNLPSLTGLWDLMRGTNPALKRWAIFKTHAGACRATRADGFESR